MRSEGTWLGQEGLAEERRGSEGLEGGRRSSGDEVNRGIFSRDTYNFLRRVGTETSCLRDDGEGRDRETEEEGDRFLGKAQGI